MTPLRIGLVGLGAMGQHHGRALSRMKQIVLAGVFDVDSVRCREMAAQLNTTACGSYADLQQQVDAVVLAVPTPLHFAYTRDAIQSGKHVFVEKPYVTTLDEAAQLENLLQKHPVIVQVGHIERFNPAAQQLFLAVQPSQMLFLEARRYGPAQRLMKSDVILDLMIHDLDIVLQLVHSPVKKICAQGISLQSGGEADVATAVLVFENGMLANLVANRVASRKIRSLSITETHRFLNLDFLTRELSISRIDATPAATPYRTEHLVEQVAVPPLDPLTSQLEHFVQCIERSQSPLTGPAEGTKALEVALQIRKVLEGGTTSW
ncbi:Gfo/Idh/MocA family oxidoreductase [Tumebacillus sp. ITR2]|uniref:Gfo/Idh/MocA family oxidoreductase n=1 Tax=Tumebacillus amylolyticus TaxID=2801339 RepID=A0ABS1JCL9_9BACL|nr:Gfo/Idh/MocA family oxidoreductase [Tumebacillus amylolyticus]MBL0388013.1 Gfo/Idh/MocA family oxidoreductase [Tumebacillus amylolyticus]